MLVAFAITRFATLKPVRLFYDSPSYLRVELGGLRLPTVPAFYALLPGDGVRVLAQTGVAVGCWSLAAVLVGRMAGRFELAAVAGVLLVGLSPSVLVWDSAILSESVATSLLVAGVTLWLSVGRSPRLYPWAVGVTCLFVTTRHIFLVAGLVLLVVVMERRAGVVAAVVAVSVNVVSWLSGAEAISSWNRVALAGRAGLAHPDDYPTWMITHPGTWVDALGSIPQYASQRPWGGGPAPTPLPDWLPVWTNGSTVLVVWLIVGFAVALWQKDRAVLLIGGVLVAIGAGTWLLAATDLERLMSPVGAGLRVLVVACVARCVGQATSIRPVMMISSEVAHVHGTVIPTPAPLSAATRFTEVELAEICAARPCRRPAEESNRTAETACGVAMLVTPAGRLNP